MVRAFVFITALALIVGCQTNPGGSGTVQKFVKSSDGRQIAYQVSGRGRPALVFIHGWLCDRGYWREQIPEFEKTHRVITLDLAGHGESDVERTDWSMEAFGADVAAVVEAERLGRVILIGHSMGGPVMIAAADQLKSRVVGIVGVDTLPDLDAVARDIDRMAQPGAVELRMAPVYADYYGTIRGFIGAMFLPNADPDLKREIIDKMTAGPKEVGIGASAAMLSYNPMPAFERITPNRFLINRGKPMGGTNLAAAEKYGFDVTIVDNVGHFIMMEKPAFFNAALRDILEQIR